jgi:rare lipoprotein A
MLSPRTTLPALLVLPLLYGCGHDLETVHVFDPTAPTALIGAAAPQSRLTEGTLVAVAPAAPIKVAALAAPAEPAPAEPPITAPPAIESTPVIATVPAITMTPAITAPPATAAPQPVALATLSFAPPREEPTSASAFYVQIASYASHEQAEALAKKLAELGAHVTSGDRDGRTFYRVRLGPAASRDDATNLLTKARALGFRDGFVLTGQISAAPRRTAFH